MQASLPRRHALGPLPGQQIVIPSLHTSESIALQQGGTRALSWGQGWWLLWHEHMHVGHERTGCTTVPAGACRIRSEMESKKGGINEYAPIRKGKKQSVKQTNKQKKPDERYQSANTQLPELYSTTSFDKERAMRCICPSPLTCQLLHALLMLPCGYQQE